jgi:hypothetical protein
MDTNKTVNMSGKIRKRATLCKFGILLPIEETMRLLDYKQLVSVA